MTESELLELFRRALRASLAVPLVAGGAAAFATADCSSSSGPVFAPDAAGPGHDATLPLPDAGSAPPDATASSQTTTGTPDTGTPGADTGNPIATSTAKLDAGHDAPRDAGHDAGHDAPHDAGHDAAANSQTTRGKPDTGTADTGSSKLDAKEDAPHDAGHDTQRDASHDAPHDAGHDAPRDAGHDATPAEPDAETGLDCTPPGYTACPAFLPAGCIDGGLSAYQSFSNSQCETYCGYGSTCMTSPTEDGGFGLECIGSYCDNGRAYAGMERPSAPEQTSTLGRYFAETAQMEAASVDAFRILRDELLAHEAPAELAVAAEVAARDEVRHARVTRRLARRYGPCAPHRRAGVRPVRPLEEVAHENAVEGCVRETYAALRAHHQALVAEDPEVRDAMATIAAEETRHAALAWRVAAWAEPRLAGDARARVDAARAAAVVELCEDARRKVPAPLTKVAGLPAAAPATRMLRLLSDELWARAPNRLTDRVFQGSGWCRKA